MTTLLYDTLASPYTFRSHLRASDEDGEVKRSGLVTGLVVIGLAAAAAILLFSHNREKF